MNGKFEIGKNYKTPVGEVTCKAINYDTQRIVVIVGTRRKSYKLRTTPQGTEYFEMTAYGSKNSTAPIFAEEAN